MSSTFGNRIKISIFGQSHGHSIGVVIDGLPAGFALDTDHLAQYMARRAPGKGPHTTARAEGDAVEIISGLVNGFTCGAPLCAVIKNGDKRSGDYKNLADIPRPGHADWPAHVKYSGFNDVAGGGHFSGRLTAPLCIAGAIATQMLEQRGVQIGAHILSIGEVKDRPFDPISPEIAQLCGQKLRVLNPEIEQKMLDCIADASADGDSVGGSVQCAVVGLPVGIGGPLFGGVEGKLSQAIFAIPGVRGLDFGAGFDACKMRGSEHNDSYFMQDGTVRTRTNNHGGVLGGITTAMPLLFKVAFKPTPSISKQQDSISCQSLQDAKLSIVGRHDPCIVPRAVVCVEAAAAISILDMLLEEKL